MRDGDEAATIALAVVIYGGWAAATALHAQIPPWLLFVMGGWLIAWQGSLQHETIHGHPTASRRLNAAIGWPPLALWLPYELYRRSHLAHHAAEHLTDPTSDPEARYLRPRPGLRGRLALAAGWLQAPLAGRLVLGPALEIGGFLAREAGRILRGDGDSRRVWAAHLCGVAAVLAWLRLCGLGLGEYLLCFVYPGAALSLLRSFAEHRADPDPARRAAVVERAPVLGLLFLNNNLHAVHHLAPSAPWRRLPRLYARQRAAILRANGGLVYDGYAEVAARFLLRPHDSVVHPELHTPIQESDRPSTAAPRR